MTLVRFSVRFRFWLSVGEDFVILACVVFTQCQSVMDGQTDRHADDG